jgi:hypothetical protein
MPRYFFNMVEGDSRCLVQDPDGTVLPGVAEARSEAIDLARDIVGHGVYTAGQRKIVVSDDEGHEVLAVSLAEIRPRRPTLMTRVAALAGRIRSRLRPGASAALIAAIVTIIVQIAVTSWLVSRPGDRYEVASAPSDESIVAVRFVPQTSMADITRFLASYKASLVGGPGPGGIYRLRIADVDNVADVVGRMRKEKVVELAAPVN